MGHKYERVVAAAEAATPPWTYSVQHGDEGSTVLLDRGQERMVITWDNKGGLRHPLTYVLQGVRDTKLRNVAEALRYIVGKPDFKPRSTRSAPRRATAPSRAALAIDEELFDLPDKEIIMNLRGKTLVWWNTMLEQHETGMVPDRKLIEVPDGKGGKKKVWRTSRNIYMTTSRGGRRIITFPAVGQQFRSVGLDQIVSIS